ncbi:hypothetical protein APED_12345 [Acanthopleuribacter pedis]
MKITMRFFVMLYLTLLIPNTILGQQFGVYFNQHGGEAEFRCECHCIVIYYRCESLFCVPESYKGNTCHTWYWNDCTGGFGNPCDNIEANCESFCSQM